MANGFSPTALETSPLMSRNRAVVLSMAFVFLAQFMLTGAFHSRLPDTIPTHWNFQGQPDAYGPRSTIWIMPLLSIPLAILFLGLAMWVGKTDQERFGLLFMGASTLLFFLIMQSLIIANCLGYRVDMTRWAGGAIGLLFASLGLGMRDLPRNRFAGIRLPWTMASDEAWAAAHRRSSWIMVIGGLAGSLICVAFSGMAGIVVCVASVLWTIVDSYIATRPGRSN